MPKTLYRYILTEVIRILAVSVVALVLVMAFATAIKPLTDGMLGADTLLKFVVLMSPSMLQYALPFAAAMGSTLVYVRMTQDNEILAAQASGLSARRLVAPMAWLGVGLMVFMLVLSGGLAPALYRKASQTAKGDIVSAMVRKLNQGEAFVNEQGGVVLYANKAFAQDAEPLQHGDWEQDMVVRLSGVAVGRLDKKTQSCIESDMTASGATALISRNMYTGDLLVSMRLENPFVVQAPEVGKMHLARAKVVDRIHFQLPNPVGDKVEFLSLSELLSLLKHPERFNDVHQKMANLSKVVAIERFRRSLMAALPTGVPLKGPLGKEEYTLKAPKFEVLASGQMALKEAKGAKVVVEYRNAPGAALSRRWEAQAGDIHFDLDPEIGEPVAELSLKLVRVSDAHDWQVVSAQEEHVFDTLVWPVSLVTEPSKITAAHWLKATEQAALDAPGGELALARTALSREVKVLHQRLVAQFHTRCASAAACLMLLVLGALISLWRRGTLPLVIFFWCVVMAVFSIILINIGGNMAKSADKRYYGGLLMVWVPILVQGGIVYWILARLKKPGC